MRTRGLALLLVAASLGRTLQLDLPAVRSDAPSLWLSRRTTEWYRVLRQPPPEGVPARLEARVRKGIEVGKTRLKRRVQIDLLHQVTGWERVRCTVFELAAVGAGALAVFCGGTQRFKVPAQLLQVRGGSARAAVR
jgi:hypothetical protein